MTRYIDADEMSRKFAHYGESHMYDAFDLDDMIAEMQTIDAVEVVKCKDCLHYDSDGGALMVCSITDTVKDDADFCSYGERKSNVSEEESEYLDKIFPHEEKGEWYDVTKLIEYADMKREKFQR